ncbi:MAG: ATP-binding protein, partial [Desulfobacterota bacterium]|nr:ATP-binding protein [Thermodesulfobacteriota bacterium]
MTLRTKTLLTFFLIMCALITVVICAGMLILQHRFRAIEDQLVREHVMRAQNALLDDLEAINKFALDWSCWDDTYRFVTTTSKEYRKTYIASNLSNNEQIKQGLSFMIFINAAGVIVHALGASPDYEQPAPIVQSLFDRIATTPLLHHHSDEKNLVKGFMLLPEFPVLIVSRPILTSKYTGPVAGTLIVGRYLSPVKIAALSHSLRLSITVDDTSSAASAFPAVKRLLEPNTSETIVVTPLDQNRIIGSTVLKDIFGNPAIVLSVERLRLIYRQYQKSLLYFIASFIFVALITATALYIFIDRAVLSRLANLSKFLRDIRSTNDLSRKTTVSGNDEVGEIAVAVNAMLETLQHDVHKIKATEEQLRETYNFLENIFNISPDGIIITKNDHVITMANEAITSILGYEMHELIGKKLSDFPAIDDAQHALGTSCMNRLIEHGSIQNVEHIFPHKNGTLVNIELSGAGLKDPQGNYSGFIFHIRDITQRKKTEEEKQRLEAQLSRAEKMETVGLLAGGVAHDLNNMLGAIIGYPDLLLDDLPSDSPLRPAIKSIKESGERAAAIVQDLLTLTRRGVVVNDVININTVVKQYLTSREHAKLKEFHPQVTIHHTLDPNIRNVIGAKAQLAKVIANLVSNAAEAITGEGTVTITTALANVEAPIHGYETIPEGEYVVLQVTDTGSGIAPEDQQRIFEPFYTKKIMGRSGTGLGMSVVWNTVKDMDGYIDLISEEGKGTTIMLYFPTTAREVEEYKPTVSLAELMGNHETVLVVDDVAAQRNMARDILSRLGYTVVTAASGEEALEYLKTNAVDLLVLDMIMDPGMDGLETYRAAITLRPGLRAVIA